MKGRAVSRFLFLNLSFIFATYPPATGGPPLTAGIFGFAGPGAVPETHRCAASWALTSRFHPYPCGRLFSVTAGRRLLPSVLSTAGCPILSGLSSAPKRRDRSSCL